MAKQKKDDNKQRTNGGKQNPINMGSVSANITRTEIGKERKKALRKKHFHATNTVVIGQVSATDETKLEEAISHYCDFAKGITGFYDVGTSLTLEIVDNFQGRGLKVIRDNNNPSEINPVWLPFTYIFKKPEQRKHPAGKIGERQRFMIATIELEMRLHISYEKMEYLKALKNKETAQACQPKEDVTKPELMAA